MTRTGQDAINYARSRVGTTMSDSGLCLQFVRICFDVGSYYYSAIDAWNASPTKHPGDRNPPPAVPLFFSTPSQYDHVVFCCSPGEIVSTFNEDIRSFSSISSIEANFNGHYLGWTEDLNRVTVWTPEPPEDELTPDEAYVASANAVKDVLRSPEFQGYFRELPWDASIGDDSGSDFAKNWLVVARRAPETNTKLDTLVTAETKQQATSASHLLVFTIVVLLSVIGGVAIGLLSDTQDGVVAGVAALIGALLTLIFKNLPTRSSQ